ncbi:MAG: hypothetical protein U0997_16990 [Sulfurimicrobium sp.]|nr:hypothetical protein [Sulfurimicrobium sp.]
MSIDKQAIFERTPKGILETKGRWGIFANNTQKILALIDGVSTLEQLLSASGMKEKKFLSEVEGLLRDRLIRESWTPNNAQFTINAAPHSRQGIHVTVENTQVFFEALAKQKSREKEHAEEDLQSFDEVEEKLRRESEQLARRAEADRQLQIETKVREDAERKGKEEAERKARAEAQRKAQEEEKQRIREEAERSAKEEAERQERDARLAKRLEAREKEKQQALEETQRIAREEAERKAREEAEQRAREEAERLAQEAAARKAQEEAERIAREEAERKAREEAEQRAREEAERLAREEAKRLAQEAAARKAQEEAERIAREEAERKAMEKAEREASIHAVRSFPEEEDSREYVEAEPGERAAKALRMLKWGAAGLVALLVIGLTGAHFVSLSATQKRLETLVSARLGEPVKMHSLHIALFPSPYLKLRQVEIGPQAAIRIADARIYAGWGTLLGDGRQVERIELEKIDLAAGALEGMAGWPARSVQQQPAYQIGPISFSGANIAPGEGAPPPFKGEFVFSNSGRIEKAWLGSEDGALRADFSPAAEGLSISLNARDIIPLSFLPVRIDTLQAAGTVSGGQIRFAGLNGTSHGGKVSGSLLLSWAQGWSATGEVRIAGANIAPHSAASETLSVSGKLDAALSFIQQANIPENLFRSPLLTGTATLRAGKVAGFDLPAALHYDVEAIYSAYTAFDTWSFKLEPLGDKQAYKAIRMAGPDLQLEGRAEVSGKGAISGAVKLQAETRKKTVRGNYTLGGTLERPTIRRAALSK